MNQQIALKAMYYSHSSLTAALYITWEMLNLSSKTLPVAACYKEVLENTHTKDHY